MVCIKGISKSGGVECDLQSHPILYSLEAERLKEELVKIEAEAKSIKLRVEFLKNLRC